MFPCGYLGLTHKSPKELECCPSGVALVVALELWKGVGSHYDM